MPSVDVTMYATLSSSRLGLVTWSVKGRAMEHRPRDLMRERLGLLRWCKSGTA